MIFIKRSRLFCYGSVAVGSEANVQSYGGIAIGRAKVLRTSAGNGQFKARADNGIAIGREAIVEGVLYLFKLKNIFAE